MNIFNCTQIPDFSDIEVTGSNMTILMSAAATNAFISEHGDLMPNATLFAVSANTNEILGRSTLPQIPDESDSFIGSFMDSGDGYQASTVVWGQEIDYSGTGSNFDGATSGEEITVYLMNGLNVYDVFDGSEVTYTTNDYVVFTGDTNFSLDCTIPVSAESYMGMVSELEELQAQLANALANQEDGITQANVDSQADTSYGLGYGDGANSITPEDGIGQADVDAAWTQGAASVTPEDGVSQADVDVVLLQNQTLQEDISSMQLGLDDLGADLTTSNQTNLNLQQDLDLLQGQYTELDEAFDELTNSDYELWGSNQELQTQLEAALANQEDGIGQADVDTAFSIGYEASTNDSLEYYTNVLANTTEYHTNLHTELQTQLEASQQEAYDLGESLWYAQNHNPEVAELEAQIADLNAQLDAIDLTDAVIVESRPIPYIPIAVGVVGVAILMFKK